MRKMDFQLQQWPGDGLLQGIEVSGSISRQAGRLALDYYISGPLEDIVIPGPEPIPERKIGLWENTCLEFFLTESGQPRYWEFNLSPSGAWNVFRFENYRQGLFEEEVFSRLPFQARQEAQGRFHLALDFTLGRIIRTDKNLEVAISAVIKTTSGRQSFWALSHPASGADFHHRSGFLLRL